MAVKGIGRKGVVFTLIAIVLAVFLLATSELLDPPESAIAQDTRAAQSRVAVMSAYSTTFEQHAHDTLATAGYFTLQNMSARVRDERIFFSGGARGVNATVNGCIVGNTILVRGAAQRCLPGRIGVNESLDMLVALAEEELGIATTYRVAEAWVIEEKPMQVAFFMRISYNVSDAFASWVVQDRIIRADVDVTGIEDPVYAYLSSPIDPKTSERRNFSLSPLRLSQLNASTFPAFYANRSYLFLENRSPSVLQRYAGNLTARSACCGVESVVSRAMLSPAPSSYANYSMSDHQLAAHLNGTLARFNCASGEVKGIDVAGRVLVLDAWRFDSLFGLTANATTACEWR